MTAINVIKNRIYTPIGTQFACFDTETTGLGRKGVILQLAIGFFDTNGKLIDFECKIWKLPPEIEISNAAYNVHKIDRNKIDCEGVEPIKEIITFQNICKELKDYNCPIVAHNAKFDYKMLEQTAKLYEVSFDLKENDFFCTMENSKYHLNLKNKRGGLKNPTNTELYTYFTNTEPKGKLHDALEDLKITGVSYWNGLIKGWWNLQQKKNKNNIDYFFRSKSVDKLITDLRIENNNT